MQKKTLFSFALLASAVFMAQAGLRGAEGFGTPVTTPALTPEPNPRAAHGMAEKEYNAVVKAALQPLRDKLMADRQALKDARASGDADKIAAAKATVKGDLDAIRLKRTEMEHARGTLAKPAEATPGDRGMKGGEGKAKSGERGRK